eukprot:3202542-Prymnesium_polylepis.1
MSLDGGVGAPLPSLKSARAPPPHGLRAAFPLSQERRSAKRCARPSLTLSRERAHRCAGRPRTARQPLLKVYGAPDPTAAATLKPPSAVIDHYALEVHDGL